MSSLDTRRVQKTGKSTFVISLPKNWATKNGIQMGTIMYISQEENGGLVLSAHKSKRESVVKLDMGEKIGEALARDIIACYLSGYRTIEITSRHMTPVQKSEIHKVMRKLIGPEIIEETANKLVLQDLLSSEELHAERVLKRIKILVKSMLHDCMTSSINGDHDLARDVMRRDDDVDKLNLLMQRQFMEILRSRTIKEEGLDAITALSYVQAASNLERIADHAVRIAEICENSKGLLPGDVIPEIARLESSLEEIIDDALSTLSQRDADRANNIIDRARKVREQILLLTGLPIARSSAKADSTEMLLKLAVTGSLERVLDYTVNIAEQSINLSHAHAALAKKLN